MPYYLLYYSSTTYTTKILTCEPLLTLYLLRGYIAPFGIKKRLKALIRKLKVKYTPSIVPNYPYTTSEVVDNTINVVNIFKK